MNRNSAFARRFFARRGGIDLSAAAGAPILAANDGPVLYAGWNSVDYGSTVAVGHAAAAQIIG